MMFRINGPVASLVLVFAAIAIAFAFSGCVARPSPTPVPIGTPTVVLSTPSPTAAPTAAGMPATPTPTAAPSATPTATGAAPREMAGCASIDEPGTYLLTADDEAPGTTCIKITASDVVLDCQNHTLSANHKVDGINVINARNVTVKNCNLNRFRMAFLGQQSEGITFVDNTLRGTYNGIWLESVSGSAFERNSAWGFSSGNAIYANNSHGNYFGRNVLGLAQRSVVLWKSGRNTFYKNSMRNSFNEAAYIYQSDDNRFESNDMDASATRQSRMYTLFVGNSKNNSFKANAMCSPGYGLSCNNATEIGDLGGNSCMVQSGCGISCGNCTLREWYDDPLVPPAIPG